MKILALIFAEKPEGPIRQSTSNLQFLIYKNVRNKIAVVTYGTAPTPRVVEIFITFVLQAFTRII
jgi:hypothetical protein